MRAKFLLGVAARVTPLTIAFLLAVVSPDNVTKACWYVAAIGILVVSEYIGVYRPLLNINDLRKKQTDCFFKSFVSTASLGETKVKVRVNVMLIRRWLVFWKHFFQYYQSGMAGYPDANLHFSVKKGACGQAIREKTQRVLFVDLRTNPWKNGWTQEERDAVKHITSVATIPLLRATKTFRGNPTTEYFGCLNVDSIDSNGADFLADPKTQEQIFALAELVQVTFE